MKIKKQIITEKICPLEFAVNSISGKWKIPIIWQINQGKKRPSEFLRGIGNVDRRVLNLHLKELESSGILVKKVYDELPPKVEYSLTSIGEELVEILWKLNDWGENLIEKNYE